MALPKKALLEKDLIFHKKEDIQSSHEIESVSWQEGGKTVYGFYKKISKEHNYPEYLARISVATSGLRRLLGPGSAEERLVYNAEGKIIGSVSIKAEGFRPFNFAGEPIPPDVAKNEVVPDTATLLRNNALEELLKRLFLYDGDGHGGNNGFAPDPKNPGKKITFGIDFDMSFGFITEIIKGLRPLIGIQNMTLYHSDWLHFPNLVHAKPYHWPTNVPGQQSLPIPEFAHGIYKMVVPKPYADSAAFACLEEFPEAHQQKLLAGLKILLTKQPSVIRARLQEYLGDAPLNYTFLDVYKPGLSKELEDQFPTLFNPTTNNEPYIEHVMRLYQKQYDELYRAIVFFPGSDKVHEASSVNKSHAKVKLPPTLEDLIQHPSFRQTIKKMDVRGK